MPYRKQLLGSLRHPVEIGLLGGGVVVGEDFRVGFEDQRASVLVALPLGDALVPDAAIVQPLDEHGAKVALCEPWIIEALASGGQSPRTSNAATGRANPVKDRAGSGAGGAESKHKGAQPRVDRDGELSSGLLADEVDAARVEINILPLHAQRLRLTNACEAEELKEIGHPHCSLARNPVAFFHLWGQCPNVVEDSGKLCGGGDVAADFILLSLRDYFGVKWVGLVIEETVGDRKFEELLQEEAVAIECAAPPLVRGGLLRQICLEVRGSDAGQHDAHPWLEPFAEHSRQAPLVMDGTGFQAGSSGEEALYEDAQIDIARGSWDAAGEPCGQQVFGEDSVGGSKGMPLSFSGDLLRAPIGFIFGVPVKIGADSLQRCTGSITHNRNDRVYHSGVPARSFKIAILTQGTHLV